MFRSVCCGRSQTISTWAHPDLDHLVINIVNYQGINKASYVKLWMKMKGTGMNEVLVWPSGSPCYHVTNLAVVKMAASNSPITQVRSYQHSDPRAYCRYLPNAQILLPTSINDSGTNTSKRITVKWIGNDWKHPTIFLDILVYHRPVTMDGSRLSSQ